jgi:hypothetical protein
MLFFWNFVIALMQVLWNSGTESKDNSSQDGVFVFGTVKDSILCKRYYLGNSFCLLVKTIFLSSFLCSSSPLRVSYVMCSCKEGVQMHMDVGFDMADHAIVIFVFQLGNLSSFRNIGHKLYEISAKDYRWEMLCAV